MDTPSSSQDPSLKKGPAVERPESSPANDAPAPQGLKPDNVPAVRFSSAVEEISPNAASAPAPQDNEPTPSAEAAADPSQILTASNPGRPRALQERRINTFQFEPVSLPASRVPSREGSVDSGRLPAPGTPVIQTPNGSPRLAAMASPPLTPAGSGPSEASEKKLAADHEGGAAQAHDPQAITPLPSSSSPSIQERKTLPHRSLSSDHIIRRASSADDQQGDNKGHRKGMFTLGTGSVPVSRETSPSRSSASHFYTKPMTPGGDANDPYAKGRRPPQQQHTTRHSIDPRFVFTRKKKGSPSSSKTSVSDKRSSGIFGSSKALGDDLTHSESASTGHHHGPGHGSMSDLKRFFRKSGHSRKRDSSPASIKGGTKTPPAARSVQQLPFSDDHGLTSKYGKLGKVLGSGAGGSVRLMKRKEDNTVFAVKEFRARHPYETEKEYAKKVTAEFCVGSTLHHGNIIETLDILQEKGRWYEVMEYAPFDLFAIVMTGKMSREEITCCFLQVLNGVTYLHGVGLAHRDLKLDNVVVSSQGIMKIIDFGSAHVFKYPFETETVAAKGIVGSDPYLAPEVYDSKEYDAAAVDIWSLAIIFCCMTLRRFPWKIPRMTDNSYRLFATDPTPGHDPERLVMGNKAASEASTTTRSGADEASKSHRHSQHVEKAADEKNASENSASASQSQSQSQGSGERKETIKGPWRILRLLPRESRRIIYRMLDTNPATRAKMGEILQTPWVADTVICQQLDHGEVAHAEDHVHVLEPPTAQQQNAAQQQPQQAQQ